MQYDLHHKNIYEIPISGEPIHRISNLTVLNSMNTLKKTLRIPKDRELKIKLPKSFAIDKKVIIVIKEEVKNDFEEIINSIKEAVNDKLYMEDLREVMDDFKYIDSENI